MLNKYITLRTPIDLDYVTINFDMAKEEEKEKTVIANMRYVQGKFWIISEKTCNRPY